MTMILFALKTFTMNVTNIKHNAIQLFLASS